MEPTLLYGHPLGSSLGLVTAFEWLGQPYRLSRVAMPEDMLTDGYKRINGRQETPVLLTEDGTALTETMAIALWLEARDQQRRISFAPGTVQADRLHQHVAFINTSFTAAFSPLWVALEMNPPDPALQEALRSFGRNSVAKRHQQLEEMIGDSKFLLGERPTLADAVFIRRRALGRLPQMRSIRSNSRASTRSSCDCRPTRPFVSPSRSRTVKLRQEAAPCAARCRFRTCSGFLPELDVVPRRVATPGPAPAFCLCQPVQGIARPPLAIAALQAA